MIDYQERKRMAKRAARETAKAHIEPAVWSGDENDFRVPFIGDRTPRGWRRTERKTLFVDTSGFGSDSEPAMTQKQFFAALELGKGYALIELGQFQGYVAEYEKTKAR